MKLTKKVLTVALSGILAVAMLVGCGSDSNSSKTTFTVVDYLNDYMTMAGESITYKAEPSLNKTAEKLADIVKEKGFGNMEESEVQKKLGLSENTKELYTASVAPVNNKYITDAANDNKDLIQAFTLLENEVTIYVPESIREDNLSDGYNAENLKNPWLVGTATFEMNGKTYLAMVMKAEVKAGATTGSGNGGHGGHGGSSSTDTPASSSAASDATAA